MGVGLWNGTMNKLVTIASFDFPDEAEAAKLFLEQSGVHAFLADDNLVGMDWFLANAVGGVKVQVADSDADNAEAALEQFKPFRRKPLEQRSKEGVTFACQECGKNVTFPQDRCGHVETCPHCGEYLDVPEESEVAPVADPLVPPSAVGSDETKSAAGLAAGSRSNSQLWIEVLAVLCLAYIPYLFACVSGAYSESPVEATFAGSMASMIVESLRVSAPLLLIIALTGEPWTLFGLTRPRWIIDTMLGCVIWACSILFRNYVLLMLPSSMLTAAAHSTAPNAGPTSMSAYGLLLIAMAASSFMQEVVFRGYLIARLERLLQSTALAVLITTVFFASYHAYQGTFYMIGTAAIGLVYAMSFCHLRRLAPLCVAHTLHNFLACL